MFDTDTDRHLVKLLFGKTDGYLNSAYHKFMAYFVDQSGSIVLATVSLTAILLDTKILAPVPKCIPSLVRSSSSVAAGF